jgi:hypothetical protein
MMIESHDRVEQFRKEIAEMHLRDPAKSRDRLWLGIGIVLMVAGAGVAVIAYLISHNTFDPLRQRDMIILAIAGLTAAVVGAALFVRYSVAGFLRFWLVRLIYEQKANTDRIVGGNDQQEA